MINIRLRLKEDSGNFGPLYRELLEIHMLMDEFVSLVVSSLISVWNDKSRINELVDDLTDEVLGVLAVMAEDHFGNDDASKVEFGQRISGLRHRSSVYTYCHEFVNNNVEDFRLTLSNIPTFTVDMHNVNVRIGRNVMVAKINSNR